jgi:DNA-directed RNA polymerase specialized sigma24 family protein
MDLTARPHAPSLVPRSPLLRMRSDEKLAELAGQGREDAFDALFDRHRPGLLAFCEHSLGSYDAARETLPALRSAARSALRGSDCPNRAKATLYRVARRHCGRRQASGDGVAGMHQLPERERTALILRELDTLSYAELAVALETSEPEVKALLVQARLSLAEARSA